MFLLKKKQKKTNSMNGQRCHEYDRGHTVTVSSLPGNVTPQRRVAVVERVPFF